LKRIRIKVNRCIGCKLCEIACAKEHSTSNDLVEAARESPRPLSRIRVERGIRILSEEERRAPFGESKMKLPAKSVYPLRCIHCPEPNCVDACITGGLRKDKDGIVVHDPQKCVGCWMCIMVCPFGAIRQDVVNHIIVKCDLCPTREVPACVEACKTGAIELLEPKGASKTSAEQVVGETG